MRFETRAIHVGQDPDAEFGAVNVPIYQTRTYAQPAVGKPKAYDYARGGNPTREALQQALAVARGRDARLRVRERPRRRDDPAADARTGRPRGPRRRRLRRDLPAARPGARGVGPHLRHRATSTDPRRPAPRSATRPASCGSRRRSNPMLKIVDIAAVSAIAHEAGARVVVDNTFATPYLQRPLELGADVVVHSVTKYLGGHSDLIGGAIVTSDEELDRAARRSCRTRSARCPGPMDCYLALRGVKTLAVRMRAHCAGAERVAAFLAGHEAVTTVRYPGLPDAPGHEVAARQMRRLRRDGERSRSPTRERGRRRRRADPSCSSSPSPSGASSP